MTKKTVKKKIDIKYLGIPNICFSRTGETDTRERDYKKQRINRGFDNSETWSLYETFARFMIPRLERFREIQAECSSNPSRLSKEEWAKILAHIQKALEITLLDSWTEKDQKNYTKGIRLFAEYFMHLWW
jgi:hypothetical protein